MKKNVSSLLLTLLFLLLISCEKSTTEPISQTESFKTIEASLNNLTTTTKDVEIEVGELHNNGLTFVYEGLKKIKDNYNSSKTLEENWWGDEENLKTQTTLLLQEYFYTVYGSELSIEEMKSAQEIGLSSAQCTTEEIIDKINSSDLNSVVKGYIIEILSIDPKNYGTAVSSLNIIKNRAKQELYDNDLVVVQKVIDVALASSKYWKDNIENWSLLFDIPPQDPSVCFTWWKPIVKADLSAAGASASVDPNDTQRIGNAALWASAITAIWNWISGL